MSILKHFTILEFIRMKTDVFSKLIENVLYQQDFDIN